VAGRLENVTRAALRSPQQRAPTLQDAVKSGNVAFNQIRRNIRLVDDRATAGSV
jgi:hypothetical protein